MKCKKIIGALAFYLASSALANLALAGAADMESSDGNLMKFEYEGDKLRINTGQEGSYMILNNEGMYVINNTGGQLMVIDAGKMIGMFGDMASTAPSVASSEVVSLKATDQREVIAGIEGEIYNLEYVDKDSEEVHTTQLVLSDDPRAIRLTEAMNGFALAMVTAAGQSPEGANELQAHMAELDKGILRYGDDMWISALSDRTISKDRFVLPAAPQDLSSMSGIADMINAEMAKTTTTTSDTGTQAEEETQKKGLVSGFLSSFNKKADEQAERQQDKAEEKVDEAAEQATDEAIDNVLDKALGKLFGN